MWWRRGWEPFLAPTPAASQLTLTYDHSCITKVSNSSAEPVFCSDIMGFFCSRLKHCNHCYLFILHHHQKKCIFSCTLSIVITVRQLLHIDIALETVVTSRYSRMWKILLHHRQPCWTWSVPVKQKHFCHISYRCFMSQNSQSNSELLFLHIFPTLLQQTRWSKNPLQTKTKPL